MKCEYCGNEHDGSYGSGRFCSKECRGAYCSTGKHTGKRRETPWVCDQCGIEFPSRAKMYKHKREVHLLNASSWNAGLTKNDPRVAKGIATLKKHLSDGSVKPSMLGKHLSDEHKKKISKSMKKAHAEGRAHNIGECRWNNEPSYPEKFFMKVIENEFMNKNYVKEKPFGRFSLDFAWCDLKRCIEIDGKQHETDEKQKVRDDAKNKLLADKGWELLRIKWSDMFNDPKTWIQKAKDFIDR